MPPQAHNVEPIYTGRMAVAGRIWRDILDHLGAAADDRKRADSNKLMYRNQAPHHRHVLDSYESGKGAVVGDNAIIAYDAIVGNMRICHKEIIISYQGFPCAFGAGVKGAILADNIIIAYL